MSLELNDEYDKIYKYCYFKTHNKDIAEDLTQETFLKYFAQSSYINRGKALAYLYTIAKNQCIDYFRKTSTLELSEGIADKNITDNLETKLSVSHAIMKLDKEEQELILLRYTNELQIGEIAKVLKISRFAVHRRLNNAIKELKKYLREEDFRL